MTASEARRLVESLKKRLNLSDSEEVIHESLKFFSWVLSEQENGGTIFMERDGCLEDIILLYARSISKECDIAPNQNPEL